MLIFLISLWPFNVFHQEIVYLTTTNICTHTSVCTYIFVLYIYVCICMYIYISVYVCVYISVQFSSLAQSCLTLCNPMNGSTLGFPVHHQLPEFTQTHVHQVSDAIQPSHPLSSPYPSAFNLSTSGSFQMSQLFPSGGQSIGVWASTSVLPMNIQDWFPLCWTGWISLQSKGLSRAFSNTTVQKHQFFSAQLSL